MPMFAGTRREFLRGIEALALITALDKAYAHALPEQVASDEDFWKEVRLAYPPDPKYMNLNNGGVAPAPSMVLDAELEGIRYSNMLPAYRMWNDLEPKIEDVRKEVARQ